MKKDYVVEAVKNFGTCILSILFTIGVGRCFFEQLAEHKILPVIGYAILTILLGLGTFGAACDFIDNITSAIAEKCKKG